MDAGNEIPDKDIISAHFNWLSCVAFCKVRQQSEDDSEPLLSRNSRKNTNLSDYDGVLKRGSMDTIDLIELSMSFTDLPTRYFTVEKYSSKEYRR